MFGQERVIMSGGEVRVIPLLDKLPAQFWALENQLKAETLKPAPHDESEGLSLTRELETRLTKTGRYPWAAAFAWTPKAEEADVSELNQRQLIERYVRKGEQLKAEMIERTVVGGVKGISRTFGRLVSLFKGESVSTNDLASPPYSR